MGEHRYIPQDAPEIMGGVGQYDAGEGFSYTPYYDDEARTQLTGIWFWHPCHPSSSSGPNGQANTTMWQFSSIETPATLTISPSILCLECQFHGYLTDGRWRSV